MNDIYISIFDGLLSDYKAQDILKQSGIISGIEVYSLVQHYESIKSSGLKCAAHDPLVFEMNNLGNPNWLSVFESPQGRKVLNLIRNTNSPVVAFHCGFSAEKVYKMRAYPDAPEISTLFTSRERLLSVICDNILGFERLLNESTPPELQKQVLLEPMDYTRKRPIDWEIQSHKVKVHKFEIEKVFEKFGTNAALQWVCDIDFYRDLYQSLENKGILPIGFLFDISHVFITADTKIHQREYGGSITDYFEELLQIIGDKVYQIHVNVPEGNPLDGYTDGHLPFTKGNELSQFILRLTKKVIKNSPNLKTMTLEIRGNKNMHPIEFANLMIAQANLFA
ncbi:hypothetical protein [Ulvibacterium marinum]|uniref:Xylose isomerase-like TIM barrel domain-containing protein n=1 Tax=Ulvibacterium marinum TaxID=2419782 RepID=A0A3B0C5B3_9FLAO|nr:hypothetical protein [Ulvibacterium marinum]RKN79274.1 hypothetical protein D7Z94_13180 [Ulvibacterium marinum]